MRDRFRDLFPLALFLALYAEVLLFLFLLKPVLAGVASFGLRQGLYSAALILAGSLAAATAAGALAFARTRWPRLDAAPPRSGLALCLVLAASAYFLHLFPGVLDPLMPPERDIERLLSALETAEQKRMARFVESLVHTANVDAARATYLSGSLWLALAAWVVLLAVTLLRRPRPREGQRLAVLRHPITLAGLGGLGLLSLLQAWPS